MDWLPAGRRRFVVTSTLLTFVVCFGYVSGGRFAPRYERPVLSGSQFFWAQAEAMLRGRLWVPREVLFGECFFVDERCYGYFGLTPSLLRLPFVPFLRALDSGLTAVTIAVAIGLAYWASLDLLSRALVRLRPALAARRWVRLAIALQLGAGSVLVWAAAPLVYQEAMAWSVAFGMLTMNLLWRRLVEVGRVPVWAIVATGTLAANARPTTAAMCVALGIGVAVVSRRANLQLAVLLATVPLVTTLGTYVVKFGEVVPDLSRHEQIPESPLWREILERNGGRTAGLVFMPTALLLYARPDSLTFTADPLFVDVRSDAASNTTFVAPLPDGGAYVERNASVTSLMPMAVIAMPLAAAFTVGRRARRATAGPDPPMVRPLLAVLLAAGVANIALTLTSVGMSIRYLPDFYPLCAIAVLGGSLFLAEGAARSTKLAAGVMASTLWSVFTMTALMTRVSF